MSDPFPDHKGKATWGERIVELDSFAAEVQRHGRQLDDAAARSAREAWMRRRNDGIHEEGPFDRIVAFGGVYSNHLALSALLATPDVQSAGAVYCLGDLGGFGPNPEKILPLMERGGVRVIQGNYEQSLSTGAEDCNCGYTDPRDNRFAEISYTYTAERCSSNFREWMGRLPERRRVRVGKRQLLLVHGSSRRVNEFLFESTAPVRFLESLLDRESCDGLLCTHSGLHWQRRLPSGRDVVNVGVIGRPPNDGRPEVRYATIAATDDGLDVQIVPLTYDHEALAREMRAEDLPEEFVETILTGWWTTCLEVLPARERERSRY